MSSLDDALKLHITNFRSISGTVTVPLDAPIILIHGPNGTGKTSVLSALELALTGNIKAMKDDDANFARHVVHEGATQAMVAIEGSTADEARRGSYIIKDGRIAGTPYLDAGDRKFFSDRCYLAQSMLGRLLDIYQKSKVEDGESALTQFVKDLLGLNQLDDLIDGLYNAGHKSRTKNLVPEYRAFESRIERTTQEIVQLSSELSALNKDREETLFVLNKAIVTLFPDEPVDGLDLVTLPARLKAFSTDSAVVEATGRLTELRSLASAWKKLPTGSSAIERSLVEAEENSASAAADHWRATTGEALEELTVFLRETFPDLPSWSSTDPALAVEAAVQRVTNELTRIGHLLERDAAAENRQNEISDTIGKEEARIQLIDKQIVGLAQDTGQSARVLASLLPHIHTDDCPVCGRDFAEVSKEPLSLHLQKNIAKLTEDAGKLSGLSAEKTAATGRLAQLRNEQSMLISQRVSDEVKSSTFSLQANMAESKVALDRLLPQSRNGGAILSREAALKGRLASFREHDRLATELLNSGVRISGELSRGDLATASFNTIVTTLIAQVEVDIERLTLVQSQRAAASEAVQSIVSTDQRRRLISDTLTKTKETKLVLMAAVAELEKLKAQAKTIAEAAQDARTAIVRRVFNESLNKLWRDLFVRLAPTEPFVPAFKVPESDSKDFAKLETVHRNGKKGGTPGSMLSAGNLNTAALTLFLALHFSVGARLPWLVLDDPVQNMDEVHVAQFAALLRTISRAHGTKVIIAVHERTLFDYLKLELSPSFEKDRLLALELRRGAQEPTTIDPDLLTYLVDAVAA